MRSVHPPDPKLYLVAADLDHSDLHGHAVQVVDLALLADSGGDDEHVVRLQVKALRDARHN